MDSILNIITSLLELFFTDILNNPFSFALTVLFIGNFAFMCLLRIFKRV